jgi:hypothetical protein
MAWLTIAKDNLVTSAGLLRPTGPYRVCAILWPRYLPKRQNLSGPYLPDSRVQQWHHFLIRINTPWNSDVIGNDEYAAVCNKVAAGRKTLIALMLSKSEILRFGSRNANALVVRACEE